MQKIIHSLRFQLPAVVVGVFVGILFLLMLFFHEMTIILVKTRQLAESAEVNDYVVSWLTTLSASARERTKLMSLGNESYLRSFQVTLNEANDIYREIENIGPDTLAGSTRQLHELHDKHQEYMELLDGFAKDQAIRRLTARADSSKAAAACAAVVGPTLPGPGKDGSKRGGKLAKAARIASRAPRTGWARGAAKAGPSARRGTASAMRGSA